MKNEMKIFVIYIFLLAISLSANDYFLNFAVKNESGILTAETAKIGGGDFLDEHQSSNLAVAPPSLKKDTVNLREVNSKNIDVLSGGDVSKFSKIPFEAKSVYVFDIARGKEVFGKNADLKLPLASVAKLMTAVIALENSPPYSAVFAISENAVKQEGDSGFIVGEKWYLYDLIDVMLVSSLNDAAYAVFEAVEKLLNDNAVKENFVGLMNRKAKDLKIFKTVFYNATGLDINETKSGAYGSPKDTAVLVEYILEKYPRIFLKTKEKLITAGSLNGSSRVFYNTNILLGKISGIEGGKTGFTNLSGGNLVFVFEKTPQEKFIIVILGSSYDGRFYDAERIIDVLADTKI